MKQNALEKEISESMIQWEKEFMGRGPSETTTRIVDDLVIVRLKGVLTKAEVQLLNSEDEARGRELIKEIRSRLLEKSRPLLEHVIESIAHRKVKSLHTDLSTVTGERIVVFVMEMDSH